ncbi:MAG: hypothetical protein PHF56_25425, partial [Desulfuromonadaceae bacterium]|nr:hypothetical protein [Desulfuromonadaceae bacterium]
HQHGCTMTARLPRIPVGEHGVWSESHGIQPDSHQRDIVSRQRHGGAPVARDFRADCVPPPGWKLV